MRAVFHASGSDAFFWGSTLGALALLVAYFLVVVSAAGALVGSPGRGTRWMLFIPFLAAVLAWCCVPLVATLLSPRLVGLVTSGFLAALATGAGLIRMRQFIRPDSGVQAGSMVRVADRWFRAAISHKPGRCPRAGAS